MPDTLETTSDVAKAAQEVAKTAGKAIDAGRDFGSFVSKYVEGPATQLSGMVEDKLVYMRWERQQRLMARAEQFQRELGVKATIPLQMKLAIPLLQSATLEDNDDLQDLWAKLLVNATKVEGRVDVTRGMISILEHLTPFDALILDRIYSLPYEQTANNGIYTALLPDRAVPGDERGENRGEIPAEVKDRYPSDQVTLALANLKRLGCVSTGMTWGGGETFGRVTPTLMGRTFVEACRLKAM